MAAVAILYFWNSEILSAMGRRGSRRISMPNFIKIGQSVAKILRFFDFSKWRQPPSWIVEFTKFYRLTVAGWPRRITLPKFSKSVIPLRRCCNFSNFQNGRHRHLGFLKSRNVIGYWGGEGRETSACQILSKSVVPLRRYCDFANFQNSGRRHIGFWNHELLLAIVVESV